MDLNLPIENCQFIGILRSTNKAASFKDGTTTTASTEHIFGKPHQPLNSRIVQNFILVWLHPRIDPVNDNDFRNSITELRRVVNTIETFTDTDQCIDFLTNIREEQSLMIISDEIGRNIVSLVHDIIQLNSIYVFSKGVPQDKQWIQQWPKVKGIFDEISPICQALKEDAQNCDQDTLSISFVPMNNDRLNQNLDQLDPTFMYTQILKEILITIDFNEQHLKDFTSYYRENFTDNTVQLNLIDKFERDYTNHCPVWWYTHECCVYSVLNRSLRLMELDAIIKMGFFIHDLHHQITRLHSEQFAECQLMEPFTTYRGQALLKTDFDKMLDTQGGLISFNNFLSTSQDLSVAQVFATRALANSASVGIVFVMTINPSIKSTPFAAINDFSYYKTEKEILFSMHTVFRIDSMIQISGNHRLWQVDLIQTSDHDSQLNDLTERIRNEIQGSTEWDRLAKLLLKLGQFNKADELYEALVDQTYNDRQKIYLYHQLGWSKKNQKKYEESIIFYEKSLEIKHQILSADHTSFAISFNEIGSVYEKMNENSKALLYYEKGLAIQVLTQSSNDSGLGNSYSNIGSVYEKMGEYQTALLFHEKAVQIRQTPPSNNHKLAYSHNNIASVYEKMGEYSKALSSHEKALEIQRELLPSNHPDVAQSYSNIGFMYSKMRRYSEAREFHQRAVDIGQRSLPGNHRRLQQWQKHLEFVKRKRN